MLQPGLPPAWNLYAPTSRAPLRGVPNHDRLVSRAERRGQEPRVEGIGAPARHELIARPERCDRGTHIGARADLDGGSPRRMAANRATNAAAARRGARGNIPESAGGVRRRVSQSVAQ